MSLLNLNAKYHFFDYDETIWRPFVFAGFGYLAYDDNNSDKASQKVQYPDLGFGLSIKLGPIVSLTFDETFLFIDYDGAKTSNKDKEMYLQHAVGVSFNIGQMKDSDKDGISDKYDDCPLDFGVEKFNGCPDSDGVPNKKDKCPYIKGSKSLSGRPDSDFDGVADIDDDCPNEKGSKTLKGCPEEEKKKEVVKASEPKVSLYTVYFESANADIRVASKKVLNTIVKLFKSDPNYKLNIEGHTDSEGNDKLNLALSKERAKIVKQYLVKKGIAKSRLSTNGHGE